MMSGKRSNDDEDDANRKTVQPNNISKDNDFEGDDDDDDDEEIVVVKALDVGEEMQRINMKNIHGTTPSSHSVSTDPNLIFGSTWLNNNSSNFNNINWSSRSVVGGRQQHLDRDREIASTPSSSTSSLFLSAPPTFSRAHRMPTRHDEMRMRPGAYRAGGSIRGEVAAAEGGAGGEGGGFLTDDDEVATTISEAARVTAASMAMTTTDLESGGITAATTPTATTTQRMLLSSRATATTNSASSRRVPYRYSSRRSTTTSRTRTSTTTYLDDDDDDDDEILLTATLVDAEEPSLMTQPTILVHAEPMMTPQQYQYRPPRRRRGGDKMKGSYNDDQGDSGGGVVVLCGGDEDMRYSSCCCWIWNLIAVALSLITGVVLAAVLLPRMTSDIVDAGQHPNITAGGNFSPGYSAQQQGGSDDRYTTTPAPARPRMTRPPTATAMPTAPTKAMTTTEPTPTPATLSANPTLEKTTTIAPSQQAASMGQTTRPTSSSIARTMTMAPSLTTTIPTRTATPTARQTMKTKTMTSSPTTTATQEPTKNTDSDAPSGVPKRLAPNPEPSPTTTTDAAEGEGLGSTTMPDMVVSYHTASWGVMAADTCQHTDADAADNDGNEDSANSTHHPFGVAEISCSGNGRIGHLDVFRGNVTCDIMDNQDNGPSSALCAIQRGQGQGRFHHDGDHNRAMISLSCTGRTEDDLVATVTQRPTSVSNCSMYVGDEWVVGGGGPRALYAGGLTSYISLGRYCTDGSDQSPRLVNSFPCRSGTLKSYKKTDFVFLLDDWLFGGDDDDNDIMASLFADYVSKIGVFDDDFNGSATTEWQAFCYDTETCRTPTDGDKETCGNRLGLVEVSSGLTSVGGSSSGQPDASLSPDQDDGEHVVCNFAVENAPSIETMSKLSTERFDMEYAFVADFWNQVYYDP